MPFSALRGGGLKENERKFNNPGQKKQLDLQMKWVKLYDDLGLK